MSQSSSPPNNGPKAPPTAREAAKAEGNPAFRALGLPRLRARLPSRNWLIFFTIVGSFTTAVTYDRKEKKKALQKWCNSVSHLSQQPLDPEKLPRKLTIFLSAPPGDGLRPAREHFQDYIRPILTAAAVDWEVVEGRREGTVRAALAERIRKKRRRADGTELPEDQDATEDARRLRNIDEEDSRGGDIVIGRNTWKEYVRGLHEGWLGPTHSPPEPLPEPSIDKSPPNTEGDTPASGTATNDQPPPDSTPSPSPPEQAENKEEQKEEQPKPRPKPTPLPPYILPSAYNTLPDPPFLPSSSPPSTALPLPHLLGILNTPIRISRFLNRRKLANETGQQIAFFILSTTYSPYDHPAGSDEWEQQSLLEYEEEEWHKSAWAPNVEGEEGKERPWQEEMVIDERLGGRMRKTIPTGVMGEGVEGGLGGANEGARGSGERSWEWKGGADRCERMGWGRWILQKLELEGEEEARCKGWEDGLKGGEGD